MSACACTIDDIEKLCGEESNAPGVYPKLNITCCDEVASIPAKTAGTSEITTAIVMRAAAVGPPAVTAGRFRQWNIELKENSYMCEKDDNGLYNTEVKGFVPKLKKTTTHKLSGMNGNNYIVLLEDMNQEGRRLIGDTVNGCEIKAKEVTNPRNGYEVSIKWSSKEAPLWYSGAVVN